MEDEDGGWTAMKALVPELGVFEHPLLPTYRSERIPRVLIERENRLRSRGTEVSKPRQIRRDTWLGGS